MLCPPAQNGKRSEKTDGLLAKSDPFPHLPHELILEIFRHMDESTLAQAGQTCHLFWSIAASRWSELGRIHFPESPDSSYAGKLIRLARKIHQLKKRQENQDPSQRKTSFFSFVCHLFTPNYSSPFWKVKKQAAALGLPELKLGAQLGLSGRIDYISPRDVFWPLMHGTDCLQRPFLTLKVRSKDEVSLITIQPCSKSEWGTAMHVSFSSESDENGLDLQSGTHYDQDPLILLSNIFREKLLDFTNTPDEAQNTLRLPDKPDTLSLLDVISAEDMF